MAAAALLEVSPRQAARLLDALVEASLLDEDEDGRYRFHGLIRLHARECAAAVEEPAARSAATTVDQSARLSRPPAHLG